MVGEAHEPSDAYKPPESVSWQSDGIFQRGLGLHYRFEWRMAAFGIRDGFTTAVCIIVGITAMLGALQHHKASAFFGGAGLLLMGVAYVCVPMIFANKPLRSESARHRRPTDIGS